MHPHPISAGATYIFFVRRRRPFHKRLVSQGTMTLAMIAASSSMGFVGHPGFTSVLRFQEAFFIGGQGRGGQGRG